MSILDRYLLQHFNRSFFASFSIFLVIFFAANLVGQMETFVRYHATAAQMTSYFLYQIPFIFVQVTPIATLLATLFTLGGMSQRNEITVLKASGVSLFRIAVPIWIAALVLSLFTIVLNERVVPTTNQKYRQILTQEIIEKKVSPLDSRTNLAYRGAEGNVYYVDFFLAEKKTLEKVTVLQFDQEQDLKGRIDAQRAIYRPGQWLFQNGVERRFQGGQLTQAHSFAEKIYALQETPADFEKRQKLPQEMTYRELSQAIEKTKAAGGDYRPDQVYLYFTISFPCAAFFMSYLAIPFALFNTRSNPIINFGICLVIAFIYWSGIAVSHTLGVSGHLTPLVAAWSPNVIFWLVGTFFYATTLH